MAFPLLMTTMRRAGLIAFAGLFAASFANAQSASSQDQSGSSGYSSSQAGLSASGLQLSDFSLPGNADFGSPSSDGAAARPIRPRRRWRRPSWVISSLASHLKPVAGSTPLLATTRHSLHGAGTSRWALVSTSPKCCLRCSNISLWTTSCQEVSLRRRAPRR